MTKKILFSVPNLQRGGAERFISLLFNNFSLEGWEKSLVLGKKEGAFLDSIEPNNNILELGYLNSRKALWKALRVLKHEKPDVVICTLGFVVLYSLVKLIPLGPNFKLISRIGNTLSTDQFNSNSKIKNKIKKFINYLPFHCSDVVIAQSESMKNDFIELFGEKVSSKVVVIHNGVDEILIKSKSQLCSEVEVVPNKINFVLLGRLYHQKGYDILINAVAKLGDEINDTIVFNICGKGPLEESLKRQCEELQVSNVRFLGEISNPYSFMVNNDCLILPSRYEGFSNTLIEAQYLGLPAIVSNSPGGNAEVITNERLGLLFENLNSKQLAEKVEWFVKNKKRFCPEEIKKNTLECFTIGEVVKKYTRLLNQSKGSHK